MITDISEDFWNDFIRSRGKVIKNLTLRLLPISKHPGSESSKAQVLVSGAMNTDVLPVF